MVELESKDGIFTLYIPRAFTSDTVLEILSKLEIVEHYSGPTALIIASKTPKIFSAGMDLKFLARNGYSTGVNLFCSLMRLYGRLLKIGVPTIAAINGHVVAGGLILALACDYRVMNKDVGTAKMTEINLGMPLPRGGNLVLGVKLTPDVHRDLVLRGKVFSPQECLDRKVVDALAPDGEVYNKALEIAKELMQFGEKKQVYSMLKISTYSEAIRIAEEAKYTSEELNCVDPKL